MSDEEEDDITWFLSEYGRKEPDPMVVRGSGPPGSPRACLHNQTVVCESTRRVYCRKCDVELDPIETLLRLCRPGNRWESMHRELKELHQELVELKGIEKNVKARVRSWRKKALAAGFLSEGDEVLIINDEGIMAGPWYPAKCVGIMVPPKNAPGVAGVYAGAKLPSYLFEFRPPCRSRDRVWGCDQAWLPDCAATYKYLRGLREAAWEEKRKREDGNGDD